MEVEHNGHPGEPKGQRREDEPVRQRCHLDEGVAAAGITLDQHDGDPEEEGEVLGQVPADPRALVALDVESPHMGSNDLALGRIPGPAEGDDVHRPAGRNERLGLTAETWVLLEVAVGDQSEGAGAPHNGSWLDHPTPLSARPTLCTTRSTSVELKSG